MKRTFLLALIACGAFAAWSAPKEVPPLKFVDAQSLNIINRAQPDGPALKRLDVTKYPDLTPTVNRYYSYPTGMAVAFETNSPYVWAEWKTTGNGHGVNTTIIAQSGLALYIKKDGKYIWAGVGRPSYNKLNHRDEVIANMDTTMHECVLYLPLYDGMDSLRIGVAPQSVLKPLEQPFGPKRLFVMGSSITHGSAVSNPGMTYTARLQRDLDIEAPNLGASGQCKLEPFFARVVADSKADAFLFDGFSNPSGREIDQRLMEFVDIIRAAHPTEPLIFLQTLRREHNNFNNRVANFEDTKREAARRGMMKVMEKYDNIYFIDPGMPIGDDHDGTTDGTHPNDLGFERMLQQIEPQIRAILETHGVIAPQN